MKNTRVRKLTLTAIMSAMAGILMFIEFPLPLFPPFLQMDVSDIPGVITAFAIGPVWGTAVILVKNLIHMTATKTAFVGELANFLVGAAFVIPAGIVYKKNRTKKGAVLGLGISTLSLALIGYVVNLYITLPFYSKFMPMEEIIQISNAANRYIKDLPTLILFGVTPFNLLKGVIISILTTVIYKPISPMLHRLVDSRNHDCP